MTETILTAPDSCRVCGAQVGLSYPEPVDGDTRPWCPEHCPDHDYRYCPYSRKHECGVCGGEPPDDFFIYDDEGRHF